MKTILLLVLLFASTSEAKSFYFPSSARVNFEEMSLKAGDVIPVSKGSSCPQNSLPLLGQKVSKEVVEKIGTETLPDTSQKVGNSFIISDCVIVDLK